MHWVPLDLSVVEQISAGRQILCKVMLFDGHEASMIIDQKIFNLFDGFYNYNKLFFIGRNENQIALTSSDRSSTNPALEIQSQSTSIRTREVLNKKLSSMDRAIPRMSTGEKKERIENRY